MKFTVLSVTPITLLGKDCENIQLVSDLADGLGGHISLNTAPGAFTQGQRFDLTPEKAPAKNKNISQVAGND